MLIKDEWPKIIYGHPVWACCQSTIGPVCQHREPVTRHHERGSPDCSEACSGSEARHLDDPPAGWPEVCQECGGSGYQCYPQCLYGQRGRAWEPWEGRTGAQEAWEPHGVMGLPWSE